MTIRPTQQVPLSNSQINLMNEYLNRILPFMLGFILLPSSSFAQESVLPQVAQDDSGTTKKAPLRNDLYNIRPQLDGSLHISPADGGGVVTHRPEFHVIHSEERWIPTRQRI